MKLFEDYLKDSNNSVEVSERMVRIWNLGEDIYEVEGEQAEANEAYRVITAERILYRKYVRNLPVNEEFLTRDQILCQPLVSQGPSLRELLSTNFSVAMTYVPLAGLNGCRAYIGRLYCVSGTAFRGCPFATGLPVGGDSYGWMLFGVPDEIPKTGNSWNLAANLLMHVIRLSNATTLTQNLSNRIVTGIVDQSDNIQRIEELENKIGFFAKRTTLWRLKWMLPNKNREDAVMINADMPETLEEAKKLIESNRSRSTDALLSAISAKSLDDVVISAQLANGADVAVLNQDRHENLEQILHRRTIERITDALSDETEAPSVKNRIKEVIEENMGAHRILSYYSSLPQIYFTLARRRVDDAIEALLMCYGADSIDATDVNGETALDFALEHYPSVASVLRKHGAKVRGIYQVGSKRMREMLIRGAKGFSEDVRRYFLDAVKSGHLDLNATVNFEMELESDATLYDYNELTEEEYTAKAKCCRKETNIFLEAILNDPTGEIVKECITRGADVNMPISFQCNKRREWDDMIGMCGFSDGWRDIKMPQDLSELSLIKKVISEMLRNVGAKTYWDVKREEYLRVAESK